MKKKGRTLFFSFFRAYCLVMLIPLAMGTLCYYEALSVVKADQTREHTAVLEHAMALLDDHLAEIDNIGTQLVNNSSTALIAGFREPLTYPNVALVREMQKSFPHFALYNEFIFDYLVYFNTGHLALNDYSAYTYQDFYSLYMHQVDQSYEDWLEEMRRAPVVYGQAVPMRVWHQGSRSGTAQEVALIAFNYSLFPYDTSLGRASVYVRQDALLNLVLSADTYPDTRVLIVDSDGSVLASRLPEGESVEDYLPIIDPVRESSGLYRAGQDRMLYSRLTSGESGISLILLKPERLAFGKLFRLRMIVLLTMLSSLALGFGACFVIARRNERQLRSMDRAGAIQNMNYTRALEYLTASMSDIQASNQDMQRNLSMQQAYLVQSFTTGLIHGVYQNEDAARAMAQAVKVTLPQGSLCAVLFCIHPGKSSDDAALIQLTTSAKRLIWSVIAEKEPSLLLTDHAADRLAGVAGSENLHARMEALYAAILEALPTALRERVFIFVGNPSDSLCGVARSMENAASMLFRPADKLQCGVTFFEETDQPHAVFSFSQGAREHLISCVMNGDQQGMRNQLQALLQENLIGDSLPRHLRQLYINNLLNTALYITSISSAPEQLSECIYAKVKTLMNLPLSEQLEGITELFSLLCESANRENVYNKKYLIERVTSFIDECYSDSDLSLTKAAERFNVSESYLSSTFKQQSGVNFFNYVESVRLSKAKELLQSTELKINEIARQVGYASSNSFCRAFKRYTGENASSFRDSNRAEEEE